ncbi:Bug family tripartite tricarboxylate transporter substrate binding protein [Sabulicella rubraurantiaca]|uniref:Bug family tripartite tricarboxylate transporter substrate binding protein n=1 Tax=Sabulicella rubraurantiaca TaxID=2811429 RepID=UPI001A970A8E|nr:tripartite tricarboxylate transporter substrate binding protein [Sabulicella rubraurantiaca]
MKRRHMLAAGLACPLVRIASAQDLPAEIRLLVGFAAGGATDMLARRLQPLFDRRGHRLIVENIPGGGSAIALARVAQARPDGRTLGFASGGLISLIASNEVPLRFSQFVNLVRISQDPAILVVGHNSPIRTLEDLVEAMRAGRGTFSAGAAGPEGTLGHLSLNAFAEAVGAEYIYVAYPGASRVATELLGNHLGLGLVKPADVFGQVRNGELRTLAVLGEARLAQLPDVPTAAEKGINVFPNGRMLQMTYAVGPAGMPEPIRAGLVTLFRDAVLSPEFQAHAAADAFLADGIHGPELETAVSEMFEGFRAAYARMRR